MKISNILFLTTGLLVAAALPACDDAESGNATSGTAGSAGSNTGKAGSGGSTAGSGGSTAGTGGSTAGKGGSTGGSGGSTGGSGGSTGGSGGSTGGSGGSGGSAGFPAVPTLGAQIDRMGRPAISTALNHVFDTDTTSKGAAKDAWNQQSPAMWSSNVTEVGKNLAIFDALDTVCGNQFGADGTKTDPTRYGTLASVLSDDRLWLNVANTCSGLYLTVEANATGIIPNSDCGGRMLSVDVIDVSYSALAAGAIAGVDDGVTSDSTFLTMFPYLAAPN